MPDAPSNKMQPERSFTNATSHDDMVRLHDGIVAHFQTNGTWSQSNMMRLLSAMVHRIAAIEAWPHKLTTAMTHSDVEMTEASTAEIGRRESVEDSQEATIKALQTSVAGLLEQASNRAAQILRLRALVERAYHEGHSDRNESPDQVANHWNRSDAKNALRADVEASKKA